MRTILLLLSLAACGDASPGDPLTLAPDADLAADDAAGDARASSCGALDFSRSEAEVTQALEALLADVQAVAPAAHFREAIEGTVAEALLTSINAPLPTALDEDPRPAAMAWLANTSPTTFAAAEWAPHPLAPALDPAAVPLNEGVVADLARMTVDGVPWPIDYPTRWAESSSIRLLLVKRADGWWLREAQVSPAVALATAVDAERLAGCQPPRPGPEEALRAMTYHGLELEGCAVVGEYTYQPREDDTTRWPDELTFVLGGQLDGRAEWRALAPVELTVAEANWWPRVEYSDAICDGVVGFTLRVDAVTGEVIVVSPAINCVVC